MAIAPAPPFELDGAVASSQAFGHRRSYTYNPPIFSSVALPVSKSLSICPSKHPFPLNKIFPVSPALAAWAEASTRPRDYNYLTQSDVNVRHLPASSQSSFEIDEGFVPLETLRRVVPTKENAHDSTTMPSIPQNSIATEQLQSSGRSETSVQRKAWGSDTFTELHKMLDREDELGVSFGGATFGKEETNLLMEKLRDTRTRGIEVLLNRKISKGEIDSVQHLSYAIDPETLASGEYVVHKTKGIGRFVCLNDEVPPGGNTLTRYVFIQYADGMAKLKADQAARVLYRYFRPAERGKPPPLSKLNDPRQWEKKKSKGRLAVQKMVVNLLHLYVSRLQQKRPPYPRNDEGMAEFAATFSFKPTPDQEQAFADVRRDMVERETPMDRLICGDVGFGKTEVALRAIFQAFAAGKQVMVLAPTTVLARQHFEVIRDRFSCYNAQVGLLSRFQTVAEKRDLAWKIKEGSVDIIIGTHALLAKNIYYNNLGLLVVDEEQRFGVKQKECIASFKTAVDVLSLSATPIPRTLYLALTGFRDASLIATPPPERVPIKTHLSEYQEEKMKAAIKFELDRDGQVYYVLPRIQGIEDRKAALEALFPGVNIGVAHGRQSANHLEETMESFAEGESEILLCTNIIESGLDIRRVNTIIVEDVQYFGLAQIYQLRGRVGRSDKEAHAYLFYPRKDQLSDEALERLIALEECCELGQGFKLAERDMAIRGFGSIFGEKQSGEVAHIGMDLFFDMLFETLLKADKHVFFHYDYNEVKLDLDLSHYHTSDYIQDPRRCESVLSELEVAASSGIKDLMYFTNNMRCEFGKEPLSFEVLLKAKYIRRLAADLGIHHIWVRAKTVFMVTAMSETVFEILVEGMTSESLRSSLTFQNGVIEVQFLVELPSDRVIERIFACLVDLRKGLSSFARQK